METNVQDRKVASRETFAPLVRPPSHAQVDFGEAIGIGGVRQKIPIYYMKLPYSDAPFMEVQSALTPDAAPFLLSSIK